MRSFGAGEQVKTITTDSKPEILTGTCMVNIEFEGNQTIENFFNL